MKSFLIALLLFAITSLGLYAIWYIVRGKHVADKKAQEKREKETKARTKKKEPRREEGIGKDSYCYPKINDVMGYELVKVVNVPKALTFEGVSEEPKPKEKTWGDTPGIGMSKHSVSAVNDDEIRRMQMQAEGNDSSNIPFEDRRPAPVEKPENKPVPIQTETEAATDEPVSDGHDTTDDAININDLEDIQGMGVGDGWNTIHDDSDYEEHFGQDELVDNIINNNADRIDEPVYNEDAAWMQREMEAQQRMARTMKNISEAEQAVLNGEAAEFANRFTDDE